MIIASEYTDKVKRPSIGFRQINMLESVPNCFESDEYKIPSRPYNAQPIILPQIILSEISEKEKHIFVPYMPTCEFISEWIDLGEDYIPRYIETGYCTNSNCWRGHYQCSPVKYKFKVLKHQNRQCVDASLPSEFREEWKSVTISVTTTCICALK